MNCVITLKIKDYYPKLESIPYENFVCLFTYGDFFVKVPLIQKSNNICKHEIETISSDIKYNIHILESNESSLIGISEMIIPFIKIKKINAPGTMIQDQKIKLIIDLNTKRKLFGTLINAGDIYLILSAEVFIPDKKNIILYTEINNINLNDNNKKKNNNFKQIKVRISNKKNNNNMDGTPRTVKRKKMIIEMNNNREIIKKDNSNDNIKNNSKNNTLNYDSNTADKNKNGIYIKKMKLDSNQVNIIDFKNKNDSLNKNNKYNENNNLSTKELKKKLNKKRSPRKITILELLEQKMQPLLSNNNNNELINNNSRSNTYYNNGNNNSQNIDMKNNNKTEKKKINFKNKNNTDKNYIYNTINNTVKRVNKREENLKTFNSVSISPDILSPNYNSNSPNTINTNKLTKNNTKILNRINRKYNNDCNIYNNNLLNENENEINNNNNLISKNKRNSSQEEINRENYQVNNYKNKKQNIIFPKKVHYKNPNIDISVDMVQRKNNNEKLKRDTNKKNNSSYSNINNNDLNSNNCLLSTDERTEQGLSEIDKIILEKGAELREQFKIQLKNNNSNKKDINKKNDNNYNYNKNNNQKINQLYYDVGGNHIIGAGNFTFETPKISKDFDNIKMYENKSPFSSSKNVSFYFTQEDLKNNYIRLIDLYHLLNKKLSKIIFENNDLFKKLQIYKEFHNTEIKKEKIRQYRNYKNKFNSYIEVNLKQFFNNRILEKLAYIKNIENKLYQDIFDYTYDDYEILRIKEIERVNKLNEERKLNIFLKVINCIVNDCGNVSQIFKDNIYKQQLLKDVLEKNHIKEKKEGEKNYINLFNLNFNNNINYNYQYNKFNKFNKYNNILNENDIFEDKIIREVDEEKEEESVYSNSNREKNNFNFNAANNSQNIESIRESVMGKNEENEIKNNNNESLNEEEEKKYIEKTPQKKESLEKDKNNDNEQNEIEENKEINIMKDILINNFKEKYGKKSLFNHINKNEFLFDNKYKILVELYNNNDIIIKIEKNKYNLDDFISIYYKNDNDNIVDNKIENKENIKNNFIYKKKISQSNKKINEKKQEKEEENINNEHQKKRRKKRIIDNESEEEEEEKNKEDNNE